MGSTTRHLEGHSQLDFLRDKGTLMFDEMITSAVIEDIDEKKIKDYLKKRDQEGFLNSHSLQDFLINSRLANINGELKIKNPAVLLFAKQPQNFLAQAEIRAVCFKGDEKGGDILSNKIITGSLDQQIEEALSFIQKNTRTSFTIKPENLGKRTQTFEYPYDAIREAVVNAVAHRDYFSQDAIQIHVFDHRLEISNPGSLLKGISKETLGKRSVLRNPTIYRMLRDYEYMEGLGQGIAKMCNWMRQAGLEDPSFDIDEFFFQITLSSKKALKKTIEKEEDLLPRQVAALDYIRKNGRIKRAEYEKIAKVSFVTAIKDLNEMIKFNFIEKVGKYRGVYYVLKEK
jgi:ATP-dependent DNA helicase RecG